ncbi:MAG: ABC transporter permease [Vicinamibacterales bacterium]
MGSFIAAIRSLLTRARFEREMREELAQHVQHRADDLVATGMPRDEAVRQAHVEFGAIEAYKEKCRDASGFASLRVLHGFGSDLRLASRRLLATPMFTVFAVLSLALGVGVTTAVYSVVDALLWHEPGVPDPDNVVLVMAPQYGRYNPRGVISLPDFRDLREAQTSLSGVSASQPVFPAVALSSGTELLPAEAVDGAYFSTIGVHAAMGRVLLPADDSGSASVVVISDGLWRSAFGADPEVVGTTVRLSGRPFEIVGVAPADFGGALPGPIGSQLWVPFGTISWFTTSAPSRFSDRERPRLTVVGRLRPGRTAATASTELNAISAALDAAHPLPDLPQQTARKRAWRADTITQLNAQGDGMWRFGLIIIGLTALALVVACTNLANLVLARGAARHQEFAVRRALGASRWRLVREQCAESLLLAVAGSAGVYFVLQGLTRVIQFDLPMSKAWIVSLQPEVNAAALAVAATALLLSLVVFGLEPALQLTRRADVREGLAAGTGNVAPSKAKRQRALLRWQVAISAGFFIISSLSVRYLVTEARRDSGVDMDRIGVAMLSFYAQGWEEPRARGALDAVLEELQKDGVVEAASVSSGLPFGTLGNPLVDLTTPDRPFLRNVTTYEDASLLAATPGLFRTIGVPILRGRGFDERDDAGAAPVVVLSETTVRKLFGTSEVLGRDLLMKDAFARGDTPVRSARVVGVARDTDVTHLFSRNGDLVYAPFAQWYQRSVAVVARAKDAETATRAVRSAIRRADPELGIQAAGTGRVMLAGPYVLLRTVGIGAVALGALTLLLAMIGLYGVQSQIVTQRTREIGVRMSVGASAGQIRRMVLKDGYAPVLQGLAFALFIGVSGRAIIQSMTPIPIGVIDPVMLALVLIPVGVAAFCACYLPARRASRVDPNVALRHL